MSSSPADPVLKRLLVLQGEGSNLAELCREAGLNYRAAQKWFQRGTLPDAASLRKIASHFRVDLAWLVSGENSKSRLGLRMARRLRQFRETRGQARADLAKKLNLREHVLELYESGEVALGLDLFAEAAKYLNIPPFAFIQEDLSAVQTPGLTVFKPTSTGKLPRLREEDYVSVPLTGSAIAAGQPIIQQEDIEDYVILHIRAAGRRTNLVASRVDGDSMEPMLHSGDIVVIDRDDKKIQKNKIYAVFHEGGLTAKYLERQKNLLILRPINPNSQVMVIDLNVHPDPVVGRITGAWKEL